MQQPSYPAFKSAAPMMEEAGVPVPWLQNWRDGVVVPCGEGGIQDKYDLFEQGDLTVFQRPWTGRERARVLGLTPHHGESSVGGSR